MRKCSRVGILNVYHFNECDQIALKIPELVCSFMSTHGFFLTTPLTLQRLCSNLVKLSITDVVLSDGLQDGPLFLRSMVTGVCSEFFKLNLWASFNRGRTSSEMCVFSEVIFSGIPFINVHTIALLTPSLIYKMGFA